MFLSMALLACSTPPSSSKDVVLTVQKHASPKTDDFDNKSFFCCDQSEATVLVEYYLKLTQAMAADDDDATKIAAQDLYKHTSAEDFISYSTSEGLQEIVEGSKFWTTLAREEIQQDFEVASKVMIDFAKKHKSDSGLKIITAFCPMAPGRWLQTETVISNPYFGSKMLTCGVFE